MGDKRSRNARIRRAALWCAALAAAAAVAYTAYAALAPALSADAVTVYEGYTVKRGDIATYRSFSGTVAVLKAETHYYTGGLGSEVRVLKLYVSDEQQVAANDKLLLLDNGDIYRAGIDGVVNEIRVEEGDLLWPNTALVQLCNLTDLQITLNVDEYDIEKVSVGEACEIYLPAPDMSFQTSIARINRVSASSGSVAYYTVTAELTVPAEVLPGMSATVTIPADAAQGVLTLPMSALAFDEDGSPYVLSKNAEGGYDRAPVTTGLSDGMTVEITGGLQEGDAVYAEAGAESAEPAFSLKALYKSIVGETVVINDKSSRGGRSGGFSAEAGAGVFGAEFGAEGFGANALSAEGFGAETVTDALGTDGTELSAEGFGTEGNMTPPDMAGNEADTSGEADSGASPEFSEAPTSSTISTQQEGATNDDIGGK